jgi:hydroxymethylpyrimidine/phosphomethylpyrimidine kinase
MAKRKAIPCALTIAGSDSGGGAGIQADLRTFAALGVHGLSAITCITAQNPRRVVGIQACSPAIVRQQLQAIYEELPPIAVKTGMLYSASLIQTVADFLRRHPSQLVVDPVMVSTSGARLLERAAVQVLCAELLPLATVVTPNLDESGVLTGQRLRSVEDLRAAARHLQQRFGCAALVKGGHLRGLKEAVDIFNDGREELLLSAPFVHHVNTHGTGCTYSAALTGYLARGLSPARAAQMAKNYVTQAIAQSQRIAKHSVLNWSPRRGAGTSSSPRGR